ncbi:unnamed protein product [Sympodiomycopsis kandeliae]
MTALKISPISLSVLLVFAVIIFVVPLLIIMFWGPCFSRQKRKNRQSAIQRQRQEEYQRRKEIEFFERHYRDFVPLDNVVVQQGHRYRHLPQDVQEAFVHSLSGGDARMTGKRQRQGGDGGTASVSLVPPPHASGQLRAPAAPILLSTQPPTAPPSSYRPPPSLEGHTQPFSSRQGGNGRVTWKGSFIPHAMPTQMKPILKVAIPDK